MKFDTLLDQDLQLMVEQATEYNIKKILLSDLQEVERFAEFYNDSGELTWKLTPQRIKTKLGSKGKLWGLYTKETNELVGTIAMKHVNDGATIDIGEMGYLMIHKDHRSIQNLMLLFKTALRKAKLFDAVYVTTNIKNRTINKLLDRTPKLDKILKIKSQFSNNHLFVHSVRNTGSAENEDIIKAYFKDHTLQEF